MEAVVIIQGKGAGGLKQGGCRRGGKHWSDLRKKLVVDEDTELKKLDILFKVTQLSHGRHWV